MSDDDVTPTADADPQRSTEDLSNEEADTASGGAPEEPEK